MTETGPKSPLHVKILAGLSIGAAAGITSNVLWREAPALVWIVEHIAQPAGQIFLRMLFMVVVPLVFTSLVLGVSGLRDLTRLGRISTRTLGIFLATTVAAGALGMTLVNLVAPGESLDAEIRTGLMEEFSAPAAERVEAAGQTSSDSIYSDHSRYTRRWCWAAYCSTRLAPSRWSRVCWAASVRRRSSERAGRS
jgi:Na+/H+-dicarboxylate symporter